MGSGTNTLDAVANALVQAGCGQQTDVSADWFINVGYLPDGQPGVDRAIAVYEYPGPEPLQAWLIDYPKVQVVARVEEGGWAALRQKMQDIFEALHANEGPIDAGGTGSQFCYFYGAHSSPLPMGIDELKRHKMAWNFRSMRNRP